ncbi:MAG: alpha/beta hydrolase [Reyranella sp.]|uniref:alpha/beta hydrolase family protein n=1 Tax=Reyranella sp. TaxID=1929291 RepID=UPI001AD3FAA9|nr:alpha/beta hydrolase [Reyranella sp.]MBN9088766.1 alpha/beta hydrolase [Reyranella sp.]
MRRTLWGALLFLGIGAASAHAECPNDMLTTVTGKKECIVIHTFAPSADGPPKLVIFLHGDQSDGGPVVYTIKVAGAVAVPPGTIKVAVLRPGYGDEQGNKSTGENYNRRDSYTGANIDEIAAVINALKMRYRPTQTVIVGHSGGAAYAGVLIGRHPGIADGVVLLSCPCDIDRWRQSGYAWVRSLSPNKFVGSVPQGTRVLALTGTNDMNTSYTLAEAYVKLLKDRGVDAEFQAVADADHNGTLSGRVIAPALARLLQ